MNLVGAAVLGFLLPRLLAGARSTQYTIPLLAIGALGAFTTFSGFAVEIVVLADKGTYQLIYVDATPPEGDDSSSC